LIRETRGLCAKALASDYEIGIPSYQVHQENQMPRASILAVAFHISDFLCFGEDRAGKGSKTECFRFRNHRTSSSPRVLLVVPRVLLVLPGVLLAFHISDFLCFGEDRAGRGSKTECFRFRNHRISSGTFEFRQIPSRPTVYDSFVFREDFRQIPCRPIPVVLISPHRHG
jgi:hypothetical protein